MRQILIGLLLLTACAATGRRTTTAAFPTRQKPTYEMLSELLEETSDGLGLQMGDGEVGCVSARCVNDNSGETEPTVEWPGARGQRLHT